MIKMIKSLIRITGAGITATAIICLLLCFYNITPVHIENTLHNTDYVWQAGSIWVKATEGFSFGKFDSNGFNNMSAIDNPDIIVLGSSHMEACQVMQNENTAYLLSEKLNNEYNVYNMGIAGHHFYKVCQYLPANLELFDAVPEVVIIETSIVDISSRNVKDILSCSVEYTPSYAGGIIGTLQKVPFFRALYHQIDSGLINLFMSTSGYGITTANASGEYVTRTSIDTSAYNELFSYLKALEDKYGTNLIICYHPSENLNEDGTITFNNDDHLAVFREYAGRYGISFIDMTDRFTRMYYEEKHVPHGFCTGKLTEGHLNKYGHAAMADEICKEIRSLEEVGKICR